MDLSKTWPLKSTDLSLLNNFVTASCSRDPKIESTSGVTVSSKPGLLNLYNVQLQSWGSPVQGADAEGLLSWRKKATFSGLIFSIRTWPFLILSLVVKLRAVSNPMQPGGYMKWGGYSKPDNVLMYASRVEYLNHLNHLIHTFSRRLNR